MNAITPPPPSATKPAPFVIFALPRSRTFWLSKFLSGTRGQSVGHDMAIECDAAQAFVDALIGPYIGTVETAVAWAAPLIRYAMPSAKFFTIRRPLAECLMSLRRLGITGVEGELARRDQDLDAIEAAGATRIEYADLDRPGVCVGLFEKVAGYRCEDRWYSHTAGHRMVIDMPARLQRIAERQPAIGKLRAEVDAMMAAIQTGHGPKFLTIRMEDFETAWPDADALARNHFGEVAGDDEPNRPWNPDTALLKRVSKSGHFRIFTARVNEKMVGYIMWTLRIDPESKDLMIGVQGPWYVEPGAPVGAALRLFRASIKELGRMGIQNLDLHHRANGRGSSLGKFFRRLGAVPTKQEYSLWIGE